MVKLLLPESVVWARTWIESKMENQPIEKKKGKRKISQ
jgi:hypothetical protein